MLSIWAGKQLHLTNYIWPTKFDQLYLTNCIWPATFDKLHSTKYIWPATFDQVEGCVEHLGRPTTTLGGKKWRRAAACWAARVPCFARFNDPEQASQTKPCPSSAPGALLGLFSREAWALLLPPGLSNRPTSHHQPTTKQRQSLLDLKAFRIKFWFCETFLLFYINSYPDDKLNLGIFYISKA